MSTESYKDFTFKYLAQEDFLISVDRLTRFKHPCEKYYRVFKDILIKFLIEPKYSARQIEELEADKLVEVVEIIWNRSIYNLYGETQYEADFEYISALDEAIFRIKDNYVARLMNIKLLISPILNKLQSEILIPQNLTMLSCLLKDQNTDKSDFYKTGIRYRNKRALKYPIAKLVLAEGITEEILLPVFSKCLKYDFDTEGIYILGAGGKSKMPHLYSKYRDTLKIPIMIILDNDASEIYEFIKSDLLPKDKIILINNGEFEDIVSKNLIKRAINNNFYDIELVKKFELDLEGAMCENIHYVYK